MVYFRHLGEEEKKQGINSGFGNGLFQIAAAVGLAELNNDIAIFPHWRFNKYFECGIKEDFASNFKITKEFVEPVFNYIKIPYTNGINLFGYFQLEKYFYHCKDKIIKLFTLKDEYEFDLKEKWKIQLKNSVSIHVRRGDYISPEHVTSIIFTQKMDYFDNSIKYIESLKNIDNILVFSDDIKWCQENFHDSRCIFVKDQIEIFDMFLMSYCENNITTNSTFSWWGSWLNRNDNKIITIPKNWFSPHIPRERSADLYRNDMIVI
jgi:hypothetical protein